MITIIIIIKKALIDNQFLGLRQIAINSSAVSNNVTIQMENFDRENIDELL